MQDPSTTTREPPGEQDELATLRSRIGNYERWIRTLDKQIQVMEADRQKYHALVNHTDAGLLLLDSDSRVVWSNDVYQERFRQSGTSDQNSPSCHDALCRKRAPCKGCPFQKLRASGEVTHHELNLFMGDRFRPVYVTAIPVHSLEGEHDQTFIMLQDLSDLKVLHHSEEALRTNEQRIRSIYDQAGAGMVTIRADGSFLQVNPTFCTMLGYTESELLRSKVTDLIHTDDQPDLLRRFAEVRKGKRRVVEMELRYIRRDKNPVWCHSTGVWQFDEGNRPTYWVALVHDVSERKRAEQALEQSQRRYETLVHSIDGIVWEADPKALRFSFVSKQAERLLGFPVERWLAQPRFWRNQIHPEDLERVTSALTDAVADKRGYEIEYRIRTADSRSIWVRDTVRLVADGEKASKLRGLMVDVTAKKEAEEALRLSEEQLRQSQKMEAIGRLAGGIAHDFNNLLTAITGYGDLLLKGLGQKNKLRREALEISKAAKRAADLTGQLLAFSRQQVLQPKVLDLKEVVTDTEMILRRVIGEHIKLVTRLDSQRGAVKADPGQVHQVLLNLAVNARDAMPGGGELTIETADLDLSEDKSERHPGVARGSYVVLTVSDSGSGMDDNTKSRLFEPFFTTKEQGKGTGLGLSTVYGIVKQSGGHIFVESSPGAGSTFKMYLPRVEMESTEIPRADVVPDSSPGTEKVLLVEDDDSVRDLAREILEMNGYTVVSANNGVEALKVFETESGTIDIVVTDLVMPLMGGRDLAQRIAPTQPDLKVLYLSGYTDSVVLQQGILEPGSSFLQKPFTPSELAYKVREALDDRPRPL